MHWAFNLRTAATMKITFVGVGYVVLSNALLLSQQDEVVVLLNQKLSPIGDADIKHYLAKKNQLDFLK
jgi:UDPglucose 6-dehydrogenase